MPKAQEKVVVENINTPGKTTRVNAEKYGAMRTALEHVLGDVAEGLTQSEMMAAVKPHLPDLLFPGGATSGWWVKTVQLDLEAKGKLKRDGGKPLRWFKP